MYFFQIYTLCVSCCLIVMYPFYIHVSYAFCTHFYDLFTTLSATSRYIPPLFHSCIVRPCDVYLVSMLHPPPPIPTPPPPHTGVIHSSIVGCLVVGSVAMLQITDLESQLTTSKTLQEEADHKYDEVLLLWNQCDRRDWGYTHNSHQVNSIALHPREDSHVHIIINTDLSKSSSVDPIIFSNNCLTKLLLISWANWFSSSNPTLSQFVMSLSEKAVWFLPFFFTSVPNKVTLIWP